MKPRHVQRAVKAQRMERSVGDVPSLGRVARMPGVGMPKEPRRRRRRGEGEFINDRGNRNRIARKKVIWTWSAVFVFLVLGVLGFILTYWTRSHMDRKVEKRGAAAESVIQARVESLFPSPSEDVALTTVKQALAVRDPVEVARFFRPGTSTAEEVVAFLSKRAELDGPIIGYDWLRSMDANGLLIDGVLVNTLLASQPRNRIALLTPDDEGVWRIDFDAFARTVSPEWPELLDPGTKGGLVRVVTARDSYFNGPFRDESQWVCYGMASPDMDLILVGYCRRGSAQAQAMARIMDKADDQEALGGRHIPRATLKIRRAEGAEARQFEITRVLAEDWIVAESGFDGLPIAPAG